MFWTGVTDIGGSGLQGYQVGVGTTSGSYTFLPITGPAATNLVVTQLNGQPVSNGTTYYVVVRAVDNATNQSPNSTEVLGYPHFAFQYRHRDLAGVQLRAAHAYSGLLGLAMGEGGSAFITTDGWVNQTRVDPLYDVDTGGLTVDDANATVAVGAQGKVSYSGNKGVSWQLGTNSQSNPDDLRGVVHVLTSTVGFFTTYTYVAVGDTGTILVGTRSASIFGTGAPVFAPVTSPTTKRLRAVAKCGTCTAIVAVGDSGAIVRSVDDGQTWSVITPPAAQATATFRAITAVPGNQNFYIGGTPGTTSASALLKSSDGGQTWAEVSGFTGFTIYGLSAISSMVWASGTTYACYGFPCRFGEGGDSKVISWNGSTATVQTNPAGVSETAYAIDVFDANNVAWVGNAGQVTTTSNAGTTWLDRASGKDVLFNSVGMVNGSATFGWAVGSSGYVANTTNGGINWSVQASGTTATLYSVAAPASTQAYAVGSGGLILRYTSGTWAADTGSGTAVTTTLRAVDCSSTTSCWAVGAGKGVVRSVGGAWSLNNFSSGAASYTALRLFKDGSNVDRGVAVGDTGVVRTLTGTTWVDQPAIGAAPNLRGVDCNTAGLCLAVGASGALYKSTDFGVNWVAQASPLATAQTLNSIRRDTAGAGTTWYVVGSNGVAFRTTDNGTNWLQLTSETSLTFWSGVTSLGGGVVIVGDNGLVLTSNSSGQ